MVFLYKLLLTLGIILCSSFSILAYPRPVDEKPISSSFLDRSILHLPDHSHLSLNISDQSHPLPINVPRNHSLFHSKHHPLVGKLIPCTSDEKICFRHNMVFVPLLDKCRPVGDSGLCNITISRSTTDGIIGRCHNVRTYVNKNDNVHVDGSGFEVNNEGNETSNSNTQNDGSQIDGSKDSNMKDYIEGDTVGEEEPDKHEELNKDEKQESNTTTLNPYHHSPPCSGYIMAQDGECYSNDELREFCGCDADATPHVLGGYECSCTEPSSIHVDQPEEDGVCRIPDFKFPDFSIPAGSGSPIFLNCSDHQFYCFVIKTIWMSEEEQCYTPLERGPCPEDYVVALNDSIGQEGYAEGACVHARGNCPSGYKRLASDRQCHSDRELEIREIDVTLSPYGLFEEKSLWFTGIHKENEMCLIRYLPSPQAARPGISANVAVPAHAVQNDKGEVHGNNVHSIPQNPSMIE